VVETGIVAEHHRRGRSGDGRFDAFLSYTREDFSVVEKIAQRLEDEAHVRVFLDRWHLVPGEPWQDAIEKALSRSASCVIFLGPSGIGPWAVEEMKVAVDERVNDHSFRVIPVLLPGAHENKGEGLPRFLKRLSWVKLAHETGNTEAFARLVAGIRGRSPGRTPERILLAEDSLYVRRSIRHEMANLVESQLGDIGPLLQKRAIVTLDSVARRYNMAHPEMTVDSIRAQLSEVRAAAYAEKYAQRTQEEDERFVAFEDWEGELSGLLHRLRVADFSRLRALIVGIGNGTERPSLYRLFNEAVGVDVSAKSLEMARRVLPQLDFVSAEAEDLNAFETGSFDLYLSFRTYQSTFFDRTAALFEAYRVLRPGGWLVVSISNAYRKGRGIIHGMQRGDGVEVDRDLPYAMADGVRRELDALDFDGVGLQTGLFEIYVYGQKSR
jgi:SAM-dependent methyltransferase